MSPLEEPLLMIWWLLTRACGIGLATGQHIILTPRHREAPRQVEGTL